MARSPKVAQSAVPAPEAPGPGSDGAASDDVRGPDFASALARLHELLNNPTRLAVLASLRGRSRAEFKLVRDSVGISDSVLSRQATTLEDAGLLAVHKGFVGKRPRTWLSLTQAGQRALHQHMQALTEIAAGGTLADSSVES